MWKRLCSKNAITGFAALFLSASSFTAQFLLERWELVAMQWLSPLGISSIVLFVIGAFLIAWTIFRAELTFEQKHRIVEDRETYLLNLKHKLEDYINQTEKLAERNELYELKMYYRKLHPQSKRIEIVVPSRELYSSLQKHFPIDNIVFRQLKADDKDLQSVILEIDTLVSRATNSKLRKYVKGMYRGEHVAHSYKILCRLSRTQFSPDILNERHLLLWERGIVETLRKTHGKVNQHIDCLLRGEDL